MLNRYFIITISCFAFNVELFAQDTIIKHYANATVSQPIEYSIGWGYATGQAEDSTTGKLMYFSSSQKNSPEARLIAILMDIEKYDSTNADSFRVTVWADSAGSPGSIIRDKKVSFSDVDSVSTPLDSAGTASYNYSIEIFDVIDFTLHVWIGVTYEHSDSAYIALRATADGEFNEAATRTFSRQSNGTFTDFVTDYNLNVALAIFPVFEVIIGVEESVYDDEIIISSQSYDRYIEIRLKDNQQSQYNISIADLSGKILKSIAKNKSSFIKIDTSDLPAGMYFLSIVTEGKKYGRKIILK